MSEKSDLTLLKRNLYYYIKNEVMYDEFGLDDFSFHETLSDQEATINASDIQRYDLTYDDILYRSATNPVTIYRNGLLVDSTNYKVNYRNGYILFNSDYLINSVEIITVSYTRLLVKIVLAFNYEEIDVSDLPIISIEFDNTTKNPIELGTSLTFKERMFYFVAYGNNEIELDNIISILETNFDRKRLQVINYRNNEPLDEDGFLNESFLVVQNDEDTFHIEHLETSNVYPSTPNEIDKYSIAVETYVHSFI